MNLAFFETVIGFLVIIVSSIYLYSLGKFQNKYLRFIFEPFLILLRLAMAAVFSKFILYQTMFSRLILSSYHALYQNWWHDPKKEPFITNASYFNALINWPIWFITWLSMFLAVLTFFKMLQWHIGADFARLRRFFVWSIIKIFQYFWLFLLGLNKK